ncbi:MAG TPA: hypothetical protein VLG46_01435 [Anaerolineae bacterium]|nr:hypothetical protein [Anaerolineae bacterium]
MTLKRLILMLLVGLIGLWSLTLFSTSTVSAGPLPPRPTPGPTPVIVGGQPGQGASIELHASTARPSWWIAVQWQDTQKNWNTVTGWQGSFDEIKSGEGTKLWWVAPADLGKGLFRWVIYEAKDAKLLAASEAFYLPARSKTKTVVTVAVP